MAMLIIIAISVAAILYLIMVYERRLYRLRRLLAHLKQDLEPSVARLQAAQAAREARTLRKEEKKQKLLELIKKIDRSTYEKLSEATGLSTATLSRYLAELRAEGKIKKQGGRPDSFWKIA
jgi:predicted HTH transcriptional regulator